MIIFTTYSLQVFALECRFSYSVAEVTTSLSVFADPVYLGIRLFSQLDYKDFKSRNSYIKTL